MALFMEDDDEIVEVAREGQFSIHIRISGGSDWFIHQHKLDGPFHWRVAGFIAKPKTWPFAEAQRVMEEARPRYREKDGYRDLRMVKES